MYPNSAIGASASAASSMANKSSLRFCSGFVQVWFRFGSGFVFIKPGALRGHFLPIIAYLVLSSSDFDPVGVTIAA
jgi:hypothetical protein